MSKASISRFFDAVRQDAQLAERYNAVLARAMESAIGEAVVGVAVSNGFEVTAEDVRRHIEEQEVELTDEQLDAVAGGAGSAPGLRTPPPNPWLRNPWFLAAIVPVAVAIPLEIDHEDDEP